MSRIAQNACPAQPFKRPRVRYTYRFDELIGSTEMK
jgi:hypothetical protein